MLSPGSSGNLLNCFADYFQATNHRVLLFQVSAELFPRYPVDVLLDTLDTINDIG